MTEPNPKLSFSNTGIAFAHKTNKELKKSYRLFKLMGKQWLVGLGSSFTTLALTLKLPVKGIIKKTIFKQFCAGETFEECKVTLDGLKQSGMDAILDYGVEAKHSEEEFDKTLAENKRAVKFANENDNVPVVVVKVSGICRFDLLAKWQSKNELTADENLEFERAMNRLDEICQFAITEDTSIFLDAEESWIQDTIDYMADAMMEKYNIKRAVVYNTYQMYRNDKLAFLKASLKRATDKNYYLGAKIVRGAYMAKEANYAEDNNVASPIHKSKSATDADYDASITFSLQNIDRIYLCAATHNEKSCALLTEQMAAANVKSNHPHLNFSQLYGMSDNLSYNLVHAGFNVAKYVPYGAIKDVIPYLIRRARENTSVAGQMGRELSLISEELKRRKS